MKITEVKPKVPRGSNNAPGSLTGRPACVGESRVISDVKEARPVKYPVTEASVPPASPHCRPRAGVSFDPSHVAETPYSALSQLHLDGSPVVLLCLVTPEGGIRAHAPLPSSPRAASVVPSPWLK